MVAMQRRSAGPVKQSSSSPWFCSLLYVFWLGRPYFRRYANTVLSDHAPQAVWLGVFRNYQHGAIHEGQHYGPSRSVYLQHLYMNSPTMAKYVASFCITAVMTGAYILTIPAGGGTTVHSTACIQHNPVQGLLATNQTVVNCTYSHIKRPRLVAGYQLCSAPVGLSITLAHRRLEYRFWLYTRT